MVYKVFLPQRIADVFNNVLDGSIDSGRERFGVCLYNPTEMRLVEVIHAEYFEKNNLLVSADDNGVRPVEHMVTVFTDFNSGEDGKLRFSRKDTSHYPTFDREKGAIVPYHTHPLPDQDFFSGKGGQDTNFTFVENSMYLDIVLSANARYRNINPPVCISFNPKTYKFDVAALPSIAQGKDIERAKGIAPGTYAALCFEQFCRKFHMSIDLVIE